MNQNFKNYEAPKLLFTGHLQTIYPALLRKIQLIKPYIHERISTSDADFLDLFWLKQKSNQLVIISHGMEGNANRAYIKGMANIHYNHGFDVLAWNYRGCSTQINNTKKMYHLGATEDFMCVLSHASRNYDQIYLVGFSLGANLTLKFLGEPGVPSKVKKACVFAAPLDLKSVSINLSTTKNYLYELRFINSLKKKATAKYKQFPGLFDLKKLPKIKTIYEFDNILTAPLSGFKDAEDYYTKCSSKHFLNHIQIPTFIINALNDPFLTPEILNIHPANQSKSVCYHITKEGGHIGYPSFNTTYYWSEQFALNFFKNNIDLNFKL